MGVNDREWLSEHSPAENPPAPIRTSRAASEADSETGAWIEGPVDRLLALEETPRHEIQASAQGRRSRGPRAASRSSVPRALRGLFDVVTIALC